MELPVSLCHPKYVYKWFFHISISRLQRKVFLTQVFNRCYYFLFVIDVEAFSRRSTTSLYVKPPDTRLLVAYDDDWVETLWVSSVQ